MIELLNRMMGDTIGRWFLYVGVVLFFIVFGAVFAWIVRSRLKTIAEDMGLVKDQLQNDHATKPGVKANLREDLDDKHVQNANTMKAILEISLENMKQLGAISGRLSNVEVRMGAVETTQGRNENGRQHERQT